MFWICKFSCKNHKSHLIEHKSHCALTQATAQLRHHIVGQALLFPVQISPALLMITTSSQPVFQFAIVLQLARFQTSTTVSLRPSFFRGVKHPMLVVADQRFGTAYRYIFKGQPVKSSNVQCWRFSIISVNSRPPLGDEFPWCNQSHCRLSPSANAIGMYLNDLL